MNEPEPPGRSAFLLGLRDSLGLPALGPMAALTGYGVMAREAGLDPFLTVISVLAIWAMPVLMGFAELVTTGSAPLLVLITLLAIAFRNLPMSMSAIPMIRKKPGFRWNQLLLAQLLSPMSWVQITVFGRQLAPADRMPYYVAFSLAVLAAGLFGAWIGHSLTVGLHPAIGLSLLLLTPLFVTMTMATAPKLSSRLALLLGSIGVPVFMQWDTDLGLMLGGLVFGTAGFLLARLRRKGRGSGS